MLQFFRKACRDFLNRVLRNVLAEDVRLSDARHEQVVARLDYLIAIERENRRKREALEEKERMSIIMPGPDETM